MDPRVSAIFYRAVVQVVFFWADIWLLLAAMSGNMDGVHVGLLRNIRGQKAKRQRDRTWRSEAEEKLLKEAVT